MSSSTVQIQRALDERDRRFSVRALIASCAGTTIDLYDFTLYQVAATIYFGKLFFPGHDPFLSTLAALAAIIPGFAARPIGAAFFGHYGDRIGRKATLIATLIMTGLASFAIGLVPPYAAIGVWGAVLLVVLRIVQGLGVSGEWGGAVLLGVEWQPMYRGFRGWAGGWAQIGFPAGLVLAYLAMLTSTAILGQDSYWGWRLPFLASLVLVAVGLYVRLGVLETPAFTKELERRRLSAWPLASVLRHDWRSLLLCFLLQAGTFVDGLIFGTFVLSYATGTLKIAQRTILTFVLIGALVAIASVLFWSRVSDSIGRRRMYVIGGLSMIAFSLPYWWLLDSRNDVLVLLAVVFSWVLFGMQYGPLAAYIAEAFPTRVRYTGVSLGYNLGAAAFGGTTPVMALLLLHTFHGSFAIGLYVIAGLVLSLVCTMFLPDRSRQRLDEAGENGEEVGAVAPAAPA